MNESFLQSLAEYGRVTFWLPEGMGTHRHQCRWQADDALIFAEGGTFAEALESVFIKAVNTGQLPLVVTTPSVITRVMDDGIKTKDGAA